MAIDPAILDALRWPLEALSLLAFIGLALLVVTNWPSLPDRVPMHFGITGQPDRYGRRWSFLIMPVVAVALYVTMSLPGDTIGLLSGEAPSDPDSAFMLAWMKAIMMMLMCFCVWTIARVARGQARRMNVFVVLAFIGLIMVPGVTGIFKH